MTSPPSLSPDLHSAQAKPSKLKVIREKKKNRWGRDCASIHAIIIIFNHNRGKREVSGNDNSDGAAGKA